MVMFSIKVRTSLDMSHIWKTVPQYNISLGFAINAGNVMPGSVSKSRKCYLQHL